MYCTLSSDISAEVTVEIRKIVLDILEPNEHHPFLNRNLLKSNPNAIDTSELLAWLFEICTIYNDKEACAYIKTKAFQSLHLILSYASNEILRVQDSVFK